MSLSSRKFSLYGFGLISALKGSSFAPKPEFVSPYLNATGEMRTYLDEKGNPQRFDYVEYPETVWIDNKLYSYHMTPKIFYEIPNDKPVYEMYAEVKIKTLQAWVDFPFKADITVSSEPHWSNSTEESISDAPRAILPHFNQQQKELQKLITYLLGSSKRGDVTEKLEYLRMVEDKIDHQVVAELDSYIAPDPSSDIQEPGLAVTKKNIQAYTPSKDPEEIEGYYVENWRGLIFYELRRAVLERARVNICKQCLKPIYLKPKGQPYRELHFKTEDLECYLEKDKVDHKESRQFKAKK